MSIAIIIIAARIATTMELAFPLDSDPVIIPILQNIKKYKIEETLG